MIGEVDEQEWGELGKALIQSFEQVEEEDEPFGDPNAEYCWSAEPDHNGGWFCHHPDCMVSPYEAEQDLTELEESLEAGRQMARDEAY